MAAPSALGARRAEASVVIPTRNAGPLLERVLGGILSQKASFPFEVVAVDSGSTDGTLDLLRRHPVRVERIAPSEFNHGLTRDLGARISAGDALVFLNQDAAPCTEDWLERLLQPLRSGEEYAAVQGGIREFEDRPRFYWDSCGPRFYFTRESRRWIPRYGGIGFSTVNAALRRRAWEACPFGEAVMMEDKKWQRQAAALGMRIAYRPDAAVFHTHNYDLRGLVRRCQQEGYGWRLVGERYGLLDMLRDTLSRAKYADLWRGVREGRVRTLAEWIFPFARPWLVYRGNRLLRRCPA